MTLFESIHNWMQDKEPMLLDALTPLVAVNSITGEAKPGKPFGEGPAQCLELAMDLAKEWGFATGEDDGYVGTIDMNDQEDALHVLAHLDIVAAGDGWDTDPFTLVKKGDLIYGRGTDDDKGPAVAVLMAMRCVRELGLPLSKNVKLILGTDEESGSSDIAHYYSSHPFAPMSLSPDSCFPVTNIEKAHYAPKFGAQWAETAAVPGSIVSVDGGIRVNVAPGNCTAAILGMAPETAQPLMARVAEKTGVAFTASSEDGVLTITAKGVPAHASTPDEGKNAITAMLELLCLLPLAQDAATDAVQKLHARFPYGDNGGAALGIAQADEVSGALTLALSLLTVSRTGFSAQFDSRDPLCATPENTKGVTESVLGSYGWTCTGEFGEAHAVDADSDFIRTLLECYETVSGRKGYCEAIGGGTYVHHIPGGVAFGAGEHDFDSFLHGPNERASITQLLKTAEIYAAVIAKLCK